MSKTSLPAPKRTSPTIAGAATPEATAVCLTVAPPPFADRSIAMLRPEVASAPVALIVPLFSTRSTLPDRSTMPRAVPSLPAALAPMVPLLRIIPTLLPASTRMPVVIAVASLPPDASILPALRISGSVAPAPIRIAVAEAPFEIAVTLPLLPIARPPATVTLPPRPPIWTAVASLPV